MYQMKKKTRNILKFGGVSVCQSCQKLGAGRHLAAIWLERNFCEYDMGEREKKCRLSD